MDIKSDIYDSLKASLKKLYGEKASKAKADAQKAVDSALKGDVDSVSAMAGTYNKDLEAKIKEIAGTNSSINTEIEKAKAEINKKIGAASGAVLEGLFK